MSRDIIEKFYARVHAARVTGFNTRRAADEACGAVHIEAWKAEQDECEAAADEMYQTFGRRFAAMLGETPEADKIMEALAGEVDAAANEVRQIANSANDDGQAPREAAA